jgi:hypothetical protein
MVPTYTDLQLHTMADSATDAIAEPLDQNEPAGSESVAPFLTGNQ